MGFILDYFGILKGFIDWRAFFDIPIITIVFLILYRTLKASGSWHIGVGIIILLLLYSLSNLFRLTGVVWIFDNLSNIALIALIIIFQPEIRKVFERTASTFRIKKMLKESKYLSLLIAESVFKLAQNRWGAIIILPGKESLESKISGGVPVNAKPSVPLIVSVFDHHSPGHDGAMIIENGEITKFGCRLPLSTSDKLSNEFGTRHHASMGLSEVSDSLIITVSEERRIISVFYEGKYTPIRKKNELQQKIEDHWQEGSKFIPLKALVKSKGSLVFETGISLILAFILWFSIMISMHQLKELAVTIPVEYKVPEKMVMLGDSNPVSVKVKISGPISVINMINTKELKAVVDLNGSKAGDVDISIDRDNLNIPHDVSLLYVEPGSWKVTVNSFNLQDVTIKPQLIGNLPDGFEIDNIDVNPETIPVLLTSELNPFDELVVTTTPIYLQTITQSTKLICKVIAPQGIIPGNNKQWPDVIVTLNLKKTGKEETEKEKIDEIIKKDIRRKR
jgi:uncharacterized protein (TIGR00159 family)